MIIVKYEEYVNDYNRRHKTENFFSLGSFVDWVFNTCRGKYDEDISCPDPDTKIFSANEMPYSIDINNMWSEGKHYWIHQISNEVGIIFSDGTYTSRQKHWNDTTKQMCRDIIARKQKPVFNFV